MAFNLQGSANIITAAIHIAHSPLTPNRVLPSQLWSYPFPTVVSGGGCPDVGDILLSCSLHSAYHCPSLPSAPRWGGGLLADLRGWWVTETKFLQARVFLPELLGLSKLVGFWPFHGWGYTLFTCDTSKS